MPSFKAHMCPHSEVTSIESRDKLVNDEIIMILGRSQQPAKWNIKLQLPLLINHSERKIFPTRKVRGLKYLRPVQKMKCSGWFWLVGTTSRNKIWPHGIKSISGWNSWQGWNYNWISFEIHDKNCYFSLSLSHHLHFLPLVGNMKRRSVPRAWSAGSYYSSDTVTHINVKRPLQCWFLSHNCSLIFLMKIFKKSF